MPAGRTAPGSSPPPRSPRATSAQLQVAWTYPDGDTDFNPLVVRDVIYTRARGNTLVAIDAATGAQRWASPEIEGFAVRGMNYWESADGKDRRLLLTTLNMLRAFDASTGQPIPGFGKDGVVDLREGLDRDPKTVEQQSRLPGKIFEHLIILGSATNREYASAPGDIRAFDVRTGAHVWSFRTIPRKGEFGAETWPEDARAHVGGANAWAEMSVDAGRGIVYVPTGSGKFNFFGGYRRGDNLFSDSLIALDARTGTRRWHFQTVHHDIWDLDNNSAPQLTTITHGGRKVDVVAMASKTGYLYVFDRVSGKPIWPIEERPVPQKTNVPGQYLSPTQPFPTKPEPFSRQSFTVADLNPHILTDEQRAQFRERILKARNDGPFTPIGFEEVVHMPGNQGGSNWGSTAVQSGRRPRLRHRLQRADDHPPAQARRDAAGAGRQPGGDRQGRVSDHRRVRALPDHRQAAVHDAHRLRPEHRRDRVAEGARRRPAPAAARHHRDGVGDDRQGRPHRDRHGPGVRHRGRSQGARVRHGHRR